MDKEELINTVYGCSGCGELLGETVSLTNGKTLCRYCGGTILNIQESYDKLVEQSRLLRDYESGLIR